MTKNDDKKLGRNPAAAEDRVDEKPFCTKAFDSETARTEDEDDPCRNAEN